MPENNNQNLLPLAGATACQRAVRTWLNTCTELPSGLTATFENLPENAVGICFATVQAPIYAARYVIGGFRAQYQFQIIYRVLPSDDSDMLDAVEKLTDICSWCETAAPPVIEGAVNIKIKRTSDVAIIAAYEDGTNDYSASFSLIWEVFQNA